MWKVVEGRHEIQAAQRRLQAFLGNAASVRTVCWAGYQGGKMTIKANWSDRLAIWFASQVMADEPIPRYWNAFGTTKPSHDAMMDITCEINFPLSSIRRQVGGAFARDDTGEIHIVHRGRIGGGRKGIGQSSFFRYFRGETLSVLDGAVETRVALVADLNSPRIVAQIAGFVREVERIKDFISQKDTTEQGDEETSHDWKVSFTEEPESRRGYKTSGWQQPSADHGLIVNDLARRLEALGYNVGNDVRDLFVFGDDRKVRILFEVKTGVSTTDIYQAIGQLFFYTVDETNRPVLVLVSPPIDEKVGGSLQRLGLRHVSYRFKDSDVIFLGLDELL